jgi:hypothetical protein
MAVEEGLIRVTEKMLKKAAEETVGEKLRFEISSEEIRKILDPDNFIKTRWTLGSTNPNEVKRMAESRVVRWEGESKWIEDREAHVRSSYDDLRRIAKEIVHGS